MSFRKMANSKIVWTLVCCLTSASTLPAAPAWAQGMAEMGAANGMSAGLGSGLMKSAFPSSLGASMNSSAGSINQSIGGQSSGAINPVNGLPETYDDSVINMKTAAKDADHLYKMGKMKQDAHKWAEAENFYKQSLYIRERVWPGVDPSIPILIDLVGDMAAKRGDVKEADEAYRRSLKTAVTRYGVGVFELCGPLMKVGQSAYSNKKYSDACNYLQQCYILRSRKLGDANKQTTETALWLAKADLENDQAPEACDMLRKVIDAHADAKDTNSPAVISLLDLYSQALKKQNLKDEAARVDAQLANLRAAASNAASVSATDAKPAAASTTTTATETKTQTAEPKTETKTEKKTETKTDTTATK